MLVSHDPIFPTLFAPDAQLDRLWTGAGWAEGPTWLPMLSAVLFSDVPGDRQLLHSTLTDQTHVLRGGAGHFVNGTMLDGTGILMCEHGTRSLTRLALDGQRQTLASRFEGGRLNSPNDVAVGAGAIWFTDPSYGIEIPGQGVPGPREQGGNFVFRLSDGCLKSVAGDFAYPNGIALSRDERVLYVADSGGSRSPGNQRHIRRFTIDGAVLRGGEVLIRCPNGVFDGFRVDRDDRLWTSAADGVHVYGPDRTHLGHIPVPETVTNLCFGGDDGDRLFITASSSLYAIDLHGGNHAGSHAPRTKDLSCSTS